MSSQYYKEGNKVALIKLGLDVQDTAAATAAGVAGAAPFAGLIGEKKIIHDPVLSKTKGQQFKTMEGLAEAARTGDVLLTTKPSGSMWKQVTRPLTSSEFYHAQPVIGEMGMMIDPKGKLQYSDELAQEILESKGLKARQPFTTSSGNIEQAQKWKEGLKHFLESGKGTISAEMAEHGYPDVVLMRSKATAKASPEQMKKYVEQAYQRGVSDYDFDRAAKTWLKDVFVPKVEGVTGKAPLPEVCVGNICSTHPAMAAEEAFGTKVVPGKASMDVMPADYLRSKSYEAVGSHLPSKSKYMMDPRLRKALPYLTRSGIGAGLAGATYAGVEQPEIPAALVGGTLAGTALTPLAERHGPKYLEGLKGIAEKDVPFAAKQQVPSFIDLLRSRFLSGGKDTARKEVLINFLKRRLPITAAGALAGGGAMYAARQALKD